MSKHTNCWILGKGTVYFSGYIFFREERKSGPAFTQLLAQSWLFPSAEMAAEVRNADKELAGFEPLETTLVVVDRVDDAATEEKKL